MQIARSRPLAALFPPRLASATTGFATVPSHPPERLGAGCLSLPRAQALRTGRRGRRPVVRAASSPTSLCTRHQPCDAAYHLCDANDKRASNTRLASAIRRRIRGNAGALTRSRALFPRLSGPIPAAHRRRWRPPAGAPPAGLLAGVRAGQGVAKRENTARWGARSRLSSWVVDRRATHAPAESTRWAEVRTFAASLRARFEVLGTRSDSRAPQSRANRLVADDTSATRQPNVARLVHVRSS